MRIVRLLPLIVITSLMLAVPASAEDASIDVPDFKFSPKSSTIDVGDTVTWNFKGPTQHTATSNRGQAVKFDSGLIDAGKSFSFTFTKPGKFTFYCQPHPFMKGSVTVGTDPVAKSFTKASIKGSKRAVKATVRLKEDAIVTLSVRGPKRKSVTKSLKKGKRSVSVGRLKAGSYKATVVALDAFKVKTTKKATVAVG
jgi:plastocyanin